MKRFSAGPLLVVLAAACTNDAPLALPVPVDRETSPFVYPEEMWDEGVEGQAIVMVHVSQAGDVDSVYIRNTSGYEALDSAAVQGARTLRFEPGRRGADPVDVWVRLPVRFSKTPPAASENDAAPGRGTGTRG
jgi:TonB family protein